MGEALNYVTTTEQFSSPYEKYLVGDLIRQTSELASIPADENDILVRWHEYLGNGSLLMLYGSHRYDPEDPQFDIIRAQFNQWNAETQGQPRLIRCEGRVPDIEPNASEETCIRGDRGEMALLTLWAKRHGIPIDSLEPSIVVQAKDIQTTDYGPHSRESYWFYLIGRQAYQGIRSLQLHQSPITVSIWMRAYEKMQTYMQATIDRYKDALGPGWPDSMNEFEQIFRTLYPKRQLNLLDGSFFLNETALHMYDPGTEIQHVSSAVNRHRDAHASTTLMDDMARGTRVFAMMGKLHSDHMSSVGSHYW